jgi:hypothetical protein
MMIDVTTVQTMHDNYHQSILNRPNLYKCRDGAINITLPQDLCWVWSNRAAGDSGGKKPRPVGIRLLPNKVAEIYGDQDFALDWIFSSVENLIEFIQNSDCDGAEHLQRKLIAKKQKEISKVSPRPMQDCIEIQLLKLAIEKRDNELAKMVISGQVAQIRKVA